MTNWTDRFFGNLYGDIYNEFLLESERSIQEASFASHVLDLGRKTVLDLACGFGRHARLLASSNKVIGLDRNAYYLQMASTGNRQKVQENLCLTRGDMRQLPIADQSVDAVLLLFNSFGYFGTEIQGREAESTTRQMWKLPSIFYERKLVDENFGVFGEKQDTNPTKKSMDKPVEDQNQQVLREIYRVLKPGGGLLMELPNKTPLLEAVLENPRRHMVSDEFQIEEEFIWDSSNSVLSNKTRFKKGDQSEDGEYAIRVYEKTEVATLLENAGFKIKRLFGNYEGERYESLKAR